jgi:hypothetical protein
VMTYTQTARPGARAPHVWLAPDRSTLDLFGRGFVLLQFAPGEGNEALIEAARQRGVPLSRVLVDNAEASALYQRRLVLVRPDGHVAWRDDAAPSMPEALCIIDTIRGALPGCRIHNVQRSEGGRTSSE